MEYCCRDYENSSSSTDVGVIHEKIKSVFCSVSWSNLNGGGLIQFWTGKQKVLSTFDEPFVSEHIDSFLAYRLFCMRCRYVVNNNNNNSHQVEVKDGMIVIPNGPPAAVFLDGFPQLVVDLKRQQLGSQLVDIGLGCGLTCSLYLPVFYPLISQSYCVGVVEYCSTTVSDLVPFFYDFKRLLKRAGLRTFYLQDCQPYKTIHCLEYATNEIEDALEIVCESHYLTAAQVWITYENENHFPSSSSLLDNDHMKHVFALKLIGYRVDSGDDDLLSAIKDYHDTCDTFPLKMGDGLATKTLQTYQPHFSKSITELGDDGGLFTLIHAHNNYSCLTICFRSIHTGDLDYVFEFLWPQSRDYLILLKSLLLTLTSCLPSFKLAPGAQLGDELCVVDLENSAGSEIRCFNIDLNDKSSPLLKQCRVRKRSVSKECVSSLDVKLQSHLTMKGASQNHFDQKERNFKKRKLSDLYENQMDSTEESSDSSNCSSTGASPDKGPLTIKAEFEEDLITFHFPVSSATLAAVKKEIDKAFHQLNGNYRLEYLDVANVWIEMLSDELVKLSITDRPLSSTHIRLRVIPDNC